jgi:hypothetical protein
MTPLLKKSIFLDRLVCYLMPYFLPMTTSIDLARADILETLDAYGARTRAELLTVVEILAFSLSALDALMAAKADTTISPSLQLRFRGCANNLGRSSHQAEKSLATRLKCDPLAEETPAANKPDVPTEEILRRIDSQIAAARNTLPDAKAPKRGAVFNTIFANPPPN